MLCIKTAHKFVLSAPHVHTSVCNTYSTCCVHHIIITVPVVDPSLCHCLQLKQLFAFCGAVLDCSLVGRNSDYAFIEFSKEEVHTIVRWLQSWIEHT
jgi:RNA recognition motif. (a.k.a. RRM, RBD, or RNP domain)